ncbi:MAG: patatin-like phospholipase family protein [Spirochaetales bacterium]|nr:patatin-like phospholipase family protein [Spirochaetales bacterium]
MAIIFLKVPQAKDAIIALGNFGNFFQYFFFSLIGIIWALFNWYWPRVFYYMEYHKERHLSELDIIVIKIIPRITGSFPLFLISIATITQGINIPSINDGRVPLFIIGIIYLILGVLFILFVTYRRNFLNLGTIGETTSNLQEVNGIIPFKNLPKSSKLILLYSTLISAILLLLITVAPIKSTQFLGDAATLLVIIFTVWIPPLYWIKYLGLRFRKSTFLILGLIIFIFSNFNGNKQLTKIDGDKRERETVSQFYSSNFSNSKPTVFILSEGGGIRAAYWSSSLLAGITNNIEGFNNFIYGISGVSGGTFGATVYLSLLNNKNIDTKDYERIVKKVVGKDYLSPVIAAMFTRGVLQLLLPVPIQSFDHAKVFERVWEEFWEKETNSSQFKQPIESLWEGDGYTPSLFINITRVENGIPFSIGSLKLKNTLIEDLYSYNYLEQNKSFKVSTASLLSARFPYVGPAGILHSPTNEVLGLVDGGYFDNSGANTIYDIIMEAKIKNPIVIYITNNNETLDLSKSGKSLFYQLMAPIYTMVQTRDAHTFNSLNKLETLVNTLDGNFYTFSLDNNSLTNKAPLGWALSNTAQNEINNRVQEIISSNEQYLELKSKINKYKEKE